MRSGSSSISDEDSRELQRDRACWHPRESEPVPMGLSNPDRASAASIYTHVARLFIPRYPHALHVRQRQSSSACPFSLARTQTVKVEDAVHVLSASSSQPVLSALSFQPDTAKPPRTSPKPPLLSWPGHRRSKLRMLCMSFQPVTINPGGNPWSRF
jgi:hypothetical protein